MAASMASVPELQKKTLSAKEFFTSAFARFDLRLDVEVVRDVHEPLRLFLEGHDDLRMAMAEVVHRDAGDEVEVLLAVGVVDRRAASLHEHQGLAAVGVHQAGLCVLDNIAGDHRGVKIIITHRENQMEIGLNVIHQALPYYGDTTLRSP